MDVEGNVKAARAANPRLADCSKDLVLHFLFRIEDVLIDCAAHDVSTDEWIVDSSNLSSLHVHHVELRPDTDVARKGLAVHWLVKLCDLRGFSIRTVVDERGAGAGR